MPNPAGQGLKSTSPPPPARLFFLPDAAHAWREEVDGTTARLGVQHIQQGFLKFAAERIHRARLAAAVALTLLPPRAICGP